MNIFYPKVHKTFTRLLGLIDVTKEVSEGVSRYLKTLLYCFFENKFHHRPTTTIMK